MSAVLDLNNARWFQDASSGIDICIHLHLVWVDRWIDDHPSPSTQLSMFGDVNEDGVFVLHQGIHNHGTKFQDLIVHVAGAASWRMDLSYMKKNALLMFHHAYTTSFIQHQSQKLWSTLGTWETSPVGKDHHWQILAVIEIPQRLCCLEGAVGEPNLPSHGLLLASPNQDHINFK